MADPDPFELSSLGLADGSTWAIPSGTAELEPFASSAEILDALGAVCRLRLDAVASEEATSRPRPFGPRVDSVAEAVDQLAAAMARHQLIWRRLAVTGDGPDAPALARAIGRWGLGPAEILLLAASLAAGFAPTLVPQVSRLSHLTVGVAASLLRASPPAAIRAAAFVSPGSPLHDLGLLRPGDSPGGLSRTPLILAPRVLDLARDGDGVSADVAAWLRPAVPPRAAVDQTRLREAVRRGDAVVCVRGGPGVGGDELVRAVAAVAAQDRRALFRVAARRLADPDDRAPLIREALLARALLLVDEVDTADAPAWESGAARALAAGVPVVTAAASPPSGPVTHITLDAPDTAARRAMWSELLGGEVAGLDQLAARARVGRAVAERVAASVSKRPTLARPVDGLSTLAALRGQSPRPPGRPFDAPAPFVTTDRAEQAISDLAALPDPARPRRLALLIGQRGSGRRALAAEAAARVGLATFELDLVAVARAGDPATLLRDAMAATGRGWLPVLTGAGQEAARTPAMVADLHAALATAAGLVVVTAGAVGAVSPSLLQSAALVTTLEPWGGGDAAALWSALCPALDEAGARSLGRFEVVPGAALEAVARVAATGEAPGVAALETALERLGHQEALVSQQRPR